MKVNELTLSNPDNFMSKSADTGLSTLFMLYFGYYTVMGFVWGGMSGESYIPYVLSTLTGLIFILISAITNSRATFTVTRIIGLCLVPFFIIFDIKGSFTLDTKWHSIKA